MSNTINALLNELDEFLIDSPEAAPPATSFKAEAEADDDAYDILSAYSEDTTTESDAPEPVADARLSSSSASIPLPPSPSIPRPTIKPLLAEKMRQDTIQEQPLSQPSNRNRLPKGMDMPPSPVAIRSSMLQQSMPPPIYLSRTMSSNGAPAPNQTFNMAPVNSGAPYVRSGRASFDNNLPTPKRGSFMPPPSVYENAQQQQFARPMSRTSAQSYPDTIQEREELDLLHHHYHQQQQLQLQQQMEQQYENEEIMALRAELEKTKLELSLRAELEQAKKEISDRIRENELLLLKAQAKAADLKSDTTSLKSKTSSIGTEQSNSSKKGLGWLGRSKSTGSAKPAKKKAEKDESNVPLFLANPYMMQMGAGGRF
ncbi:hypothetical protein HDU79_007211 [Rhizoclosmatium sp. JEL0117]|nr:hypothetical protein HDU79_007211 [Rhizoclosmatium sp. JEL0117]